MVSTEENSLSDLLGAALPKGVLAGLPGLRGISSPDVPAFAAKPAIEAFSYGTATPAMGELAEAALAYTHDEPHAATTQAPASLTLVADNDTAGEDAESAAVKAEATQLLTEILRMDPEVKAGLGAEIALLKAAQQSGRASGIDFERIRDRIAAAETNAQNSKAESEEQKRERLFQEMDAVNKELDDFWAGVRLSPEQRAALDEAKEREDEARRRYEANPTEENRKAWADASRHNTETQREIYEEVKPTLTPQQQQQFEPKISRKEEITNRVANDYLGIAQQQNLRAEPTVSIESNTNPVLAQAQAALSSTAIAYNVGAEELSRPLETPAEAAAAASRGTIRNI